MLCNAFATTGAAKISQLIMQRVYPQNILTNSNLPHGRRVSGLVPMLGGGKGPPEFVHAREEASSWKNDDDTSDRNIRRSLMHASIISTYEVTRTPTLYVDA